MSYSVCFECDKIVSGYEKYCPECAKTRVQDTEFWKSVKAYGEYIHHRGLTTEEYATARELEAKVLNDIIRTAKEMGYVVDEDQTREEIAELAQELEALPPPTTTIGMNVAQVNDMLRTAKPMDYIHDKGPTRDEIIAAHGQPPVYVLRPAPEILLPKKQKHAWTIPGGMQNRRGR